MSKDKVVNLPFERSFTLEDEMLVKVMELIYSYDGRVSTASVHGVLHLAGLNIDREILADAME